MDNEKCMCERNAPKLIFSCCGSADVGEIADLVARKLHKEKIGNMYCLTGIGAGLSGFIQSTKAASDVLVIDGCPIDCAKKLLEKNNITNFKWIRITEFGLEKGKTSVDEKNIELVTAKCREILNS